MEKYYYESNYGYSSFYALGFIHAILKTKCKFRKYKDFRLRVIGKF